MHCIADAARNYMSYYRAVPCVAVAVRDLILRDFAAAVRVHVSQSVALPLLRASTLSYTTALLDGA
jgi:hypothetical protein